MEADVRNVIQAQIRILRSLKLAALQLEYTTGDVLSLSLLPNETTSELRQERASGRAAVTALTALMKDLVTIIEKASGELQPFKKFVEECDRNLQKLEPRISLRGELEEKGKK